MPGTSPGMTKNIAAMTLPLASRIALVTGASRGIGYATARALARAGAHIVAVARTPGRPRRTRRRNPKGRRQRHAGAAQPHRLRGHRAAWRGAARAPRQARHSRRQCRRRRSFLAARPYRAEAVDRRDGDQRTGELPVDPLHGAAAQAVRRRPRGVHHVGRGQQGRRLSRSLCRLESRARGAGAGVGQ